MTPDWLLLGSAFLSALLGGAHCAAMCGGIATAFSAMGRAASLRVAAVANAGRVLGYILAGAAAGGLGHGIVEFVQSRALRSGLRITVGAVLVIAALRLLDSRGRFAALGRPGRIAWGWLAPLHRRLLPADTLPKRLLAGVLWGWLPCGLSGTVLTAAWLQASTAGGALVMAAFGLGTLPLMLSLTWSGSRLGGLFQRRGLRVAAGLLVMAAGLVTAAAPWLMQVPAAHRVLSALGCVTP
ncbi:MAG: hypothetical protein RLZZ200_2339 [Pseudomonadota bacterium]|jgi:sulfite exporter TauE/SafE